MRNDPFPVGWLWLGTLASFCALFVTTAGCGRAPQEPTQRAAGPSSLPDAEVLHLNSLACGYLDQYESGRKKAISLLREVVQRAPKWIPGRINLAIALFNDVTPNNPQETQAKLAEAQQILLDVLRDDPNNAHAAFCMGIIFSHLGNAAQAAPYFELVTQVDPKDAYAWYWLGKCYESLQDFTRWRQCMEKAVALNPNVQSFLYGLAMAHLRLGDKKKGAELMKKRTQLEAAKVATSAGIVYGEMGPYAMPIGTVRRYPPPDELRIPLLEPVEQLSVHLEDGARWATWDDYQAPGVPQVAREFRRRLGFPWGVFDYDNDGDQDLLLLGAVVRQGSIGNVLLRNDGQWRWTDVTEQAGLGAPMLSVGVAIADYNNDGLPDLYFCNVGPNRLYRNSGLKFVDDSDAAQVRGNSGVSAAAVWVDLDQDADLDLYVAQLGTLDQVAAWLGGGQPPAGGDLLYLNVGVPSRVPQKEEPAAGAREKPDEVVMLSTAFKEAEVSAIRAQRSTFSVTVTDLDNDNDLDLLLGKADGKIVALLNHRLLELDEKALMPPASPSAVPDAEPAGEALPVAVEGPMPIVVAADFNKDGCRDLLAICPSGQGRLYRALGAPKPTDFPVGPDELVYGPGSELLANLRQFRTVDMDLDGWFDVVALQDHRPVLLYNERQRLVARDRLPPMAELAGGQLDALVPADWDGDGPVDLIGWTPGHGLVAYCSRGNGNRWFRLRITGVRDEGKQLRMAADGFGTKLILHAADLWIPAELVPTTSGGCAALEPLTFGLGHRQQVDAIRVRWPDNSLQGEVNLPANQLVTVRQEQRKTISCPLLFAFNGQRYEFIADFLGVGGLGYLLAPGQYNPPDWDEYLKVEGHQLRPVHGVYRLAIAEPMDEVCYLDTVELLVIDHPADVIVHPEERFAPPSNRPSGQVLAFVERIHPHHARDHHGHDVTDKVRQWDRDAVDDFHLLTCWPGYAEDHTLELEFPAEVRSRWREGDRMYLALAGWVEYAFSDTNYAASTAGIRLSLPSIDVWDPAQGWREAIRDAGIPAGWPKLMSVDLTQQLPPSGPIRLRIRTNMQVYWDEAFLAVVRPDTPVRVHSLRPSKAELFYRGHLKEFSPDGRWPKVFDYHETDAVPLVRQFGAYTRYGSVEPLLAGEDDALVIFGAGDALELEFEATGVPTPPPGWSRSFIVKTVGFCKSADPLTLTADTVEPLPFRRMKAYPPGSDERPADRRVAELHRRYNTRIYGPVAEAQRRLEAERRR